MTAIHLPNDYGYVILVFVASVILNNWHGYLVTNRRKKDNVEYPATYKLDFDEASKTISQDNVFNCYQRAHQNFLENYFPNMGMMFFGGLTYPRLAAIAGAVFLAGRVVYALGYQTGNPKARARGSFQYIGILTLLGTSLLTAFAHIQNKPL